MQSPGLICSPLLVLQNSTRAWIGWHELEKYVSYCLIIYQTVQILQINKWWKKTTSKICHPASMGRILCWPYWTIDLSLKREVSWKVRGMCKFPELENYELSLTLKMKLPAGCRIFCVMILVVSKSIFWHIADTTSPYYTGMHFGTHRIFPWHLWTFVDSFWVSFWCKDVFTDTSSLYNILLQMGVFGNISRLDTYGTQRLCEPMDCVNTLKAKKDHKLMICVSQWLTQLLVGMK